MSAVSNGSMRGVPSWLRAMRVALGSLLVVSICAALGAIGYTAIVGASSPIVVPTGIIPCAAICAVVSMLFRLAALLLELPPPVSAQMCLAFAEHVKNMRLKRGARAINEAESAA